MPIALDPSLDVTHERVPEPALPDSDSDLLHIEHIFGEIIEQEREAQENAEPPAHPDEFDYGALRLNRRNRDIEDQMFWELEAIRNDAALHDNQFILILDVVGVPPFAYAGPPDHARYCEDCEVWLNGPTQWDDHKIGKKHKKRVKKNSKLAKKTAEAEFAALCRQCAREIAADAEEYVVVLMLDDVKEEPLDDDVKAEPIDIKKEPLDHDPWTDFDETDDPARTAAPGFHTKGNLWNDWLVVESQWRLLVNAQWADRPLLVAKAVD